MSFSLLISTKNQHKIQRFCKSFLFYLIIAIDADLQCVNVNHLKHTTRKIGRCHLSSIHLSPSSWENWVDNDDQQGTGSFILPLLAALVTAENILSFKSYNFGSIKTSGLDLS